MRNRLQVTRPDWDRVDRARQVSIGNRAPVGLHSPRWQNVDNGVYRSPGPNTGYHGIETGFEAMRTEALLGETTFKDGS